jgi:capsular exopolysaccharide synthesis family protein
VSNFETNSKSQTRYWDALRQHWRIVALVVAVGVTAAAAYSFTTTPRYEASADLLVTPIDSGDETFTGINILREGAESRSVLTAARLVQTPAIAEAVKERLQLTDSARSLLRQIDVRPQAQSNILTIVAQADDADRAAALANAFAASIVAQRTELFQKQLASVLTRLQNRLKLINNPASPESVAISQRLGSLRALSGGSDPTLTIAVPAEVPNSPVWPRPAMSIAVAFIASLLLASGLALALEVFHPRIRNEDTLVLEHRLPILARVPRMSSATLHDYLTMQALPPVVLESYRTLLVNLAAAGTGTSYPQTILVTSAVTGDGKTMTAVNLATTLAKANQRVILVDGDLRRPMVGSVMGVPRLRGTFANVLLGTADVETALVPARGYGDQLRILASTPESGLLIDLLRSDRVDRALASLRHEADVVVIDSSPLNDVADALILADAVDAVVVAVRLGHTGREQLLELRQTLARRGITPVGFVVTTTRRAGRGYYGSTVEAETTNERIPSDARLPTARR